LSFIDRLNRLIHLPPRQILRVVMGRLRPSFSRFWERLCYSSDGGKRFSSSRKFSLKPLNLLHPEVFKPEFSKFFSAAFPKDAESIVAQAKQIANMKFDLLGSGPIDFKEFHKRPDLKFIPSGGGKTLARGGITGLIPWHFDFKSGIGWEPSTFYSQVTYGKHPGVDIKVPWELSRCQHLVTLGQAYRITGDENFATIFTEHILDWIRQNPVKYGVNWSSPMDVGLRACNWILAYEFFKGSPALNPAFVEKIANNLWEHGNHIKNHLEWGGNISSNHYLSNLIGLIYIGFSLNIKKWYEFSIKELTAEINSQIYDDGFDYESSTAYFRLVLEIFFFSGLVGLKSQTTTGESKGERLGKIFGPVYPGKLSQMFKTLHQLLNQAGKIPLVGDNDSGRVHIFQKREDRDMTYLLGFGTLLFEDDNMRIYNQPTPAELVWLFGNPGKERFEKLQGGMASHLLYRGPGSSGIVVMRGNKDHLVFSAQPNGIRGVGSHTHNDKLSFTLTVGEEDFFIDPGSGFYTPHPEIRNRLRGTAAHNTLQIDREEQNRINPQALFALSNDAQVEIVTWDENSLICAQHYGYLRLPGHIIHKRAIKRIENPLKYIITDEVRGSGEHNLQWNFILAPGVSARNLDSPHWEFKGISQTIRLTFENWRGKTTLDEAEYSPAYGIIEKTKALKFEIGAQLPNEFTINLEII